MTQTNKILGTDEAWDTALLGESEEHTQALDAEAQKTEDVALDEALGLRMISIRLEQSLIEDFKQIAALNGMGYQPLMRQALKRFADCEKKRILAEAYNAMKERKQESENSRNTDDNHKQKKAA